MTRNAFFSVTLWSLMSLWTVHGNSFSKNSLYQSNSSVSQQASSESYTDPKDGSWVVFTDTHQMINGVNLRTLKEKRHRKDGSILECKFSVDKNRNQTTVEKVKFPDGSSLCTETILKKDGTKIVYEIKTDHNGLKTFTKSEDFEKTKKDSSTLPEEKSASKTMDMDAPVLNDLKKIFMEKLTIMFNKIQNILKNNQELLKNENESMDLNNSSSVCSEPENKTQQESSQVLSDPECLESTQRP